MRSSKLFLLIIIYTLNIVSNANSIHVKSNLKLLSAIKPKYIPIHSSHKLEIVKTKNFMKSLTTLINNSIMPYTQRINKDYLLQMKVGSYFLLWYLFTIGYNLSNKVMLNIVSLPVTIGTIQVLIN